MLAYNSDPNVKRAILRQLAAHREADEIVKGQYWENGKGCAVGCTLHSGEHVEYESRFGIPQMLARLEDAIFEGLPNEVSKEWNGEARHTARYDLANLTQAQAYYLAGMGDALAYLIHDCPTTKHAQQMIAKMRAAVRALPEEKNR